MKKFNQLAKKKKKKKKSKLKLLSSIKTKVATIKFPKKPLFFFSTENRLGAESVNLI